MLKAIVFLIALSISATAFSASIEFESAWVAPTTYVDNTPMNEPPAFYRLYVCDQPIDDNKSCSGNLAVFEVDHKLNDDQAFKNAYESNLSDGTLYFRVSAVIQESINEVIQDIESDLSEVATMEFRTIVATNPPGAFRVTGANAIIILK
jgi:hypothetical protein